MLQFMTKPFDSVYNIIKIKRNSVGLGKNTKLNGRVYFNGKNISIGNNVRINSGFRFNAIGGQERSMFITRKEGKIIIGNNTGISNSTIVSCSKIIIGNNVLIGGSCKIYDTDFHSINPVERIKGAGTKCKDVTICDGVFIGAHSIILKGVTIGKNSVVGAGSVVTKDIPENEVWGGNPAKFLKTIDVEK